MVNTANRRVNKVIERRMSIWANSRNFRVNTIDFRVNTSKWKCVGHDFVELFPLDLYTTRKKYYVEKINESIHQVWSTKFVQRGGHRDLV